MSNEIQKVNSEVISKLQDAMELGFSSSQMIGFEKAFNTANAVQSMRNALTNEVMNPIMALQGSRLGFRTDKDKTGGYHVSIVKDCCMEALFYGLQLTGNQFNIIAGNMYPTKEGFTYLLNNISKLNYEIVMQVPEPFSKSIKTKALVKWNYNGKENERSLEFVVSAFGNNADAANGKGERRAKCWLYNYVTGNVLKDGEASMSVEDQTAQAEIKTIIEEDGNKIDAESGDILESAKKEDIEELKNKTELPGVFG